MYSKTSRIIYILLLLFLVTSFLIALMPDKVQGETLLGTTTRVSVASDGTQGNDFSEFSAISDDGRFVAFSSYSNNLVSGDTNNNSDIFVHDRTTGETIRASVASDGTQGNDFSTQPSISADGRYVTFVSDSDNLVSGDTNEVRDVFVHDIQTRQTTRVSVASDGTQGNNSVTLISAISPDGRYVAFGSLANNLVVGDTNNGTDTFIHDRLTGETTRISLASDETQGNWNSLSPSISSDIRYVAFESNASNLVSDDTNNSTDVFVHDRVTGETTRVSVATDGTQGNAFSHRPSISADGRFIAFYSEASNLVSGDTNESWDVFIHDQLTGETTRVSVASDGTQANGSSHDPSISADGRFVVFPSDADNLVVGDTNNSRDIFLHDRQTKETIRISIASDGTQGNGTSNRWPTISSDGRYIAFSSSSSNLTDNDTNNYSDVFVHEHESNNLVAISKIEVIQVVSKGQNNEQDFEIPLIAEKPTFVRVYITCNDECSGLAVTGRLRAYDSDNQELPNSPKKPNPKNSNVFVSNIKNWQIYRPFLNKTLNFTLPPGWLKDDVILKVDIYDVNNEVYFTERISSVTFKKIPPLVVYYVSVVDLGRYPNEGTMVTGYSLGEQFFPFPKITYIPILEPFYWNRSDDCQLKTGSWNSLCLRNDLLSQLNDSYPKQIKRGFVVGWLPENSFEDIGAGGEAKEEERVAFVVETASEAERRFAHEVGHLLGIEHTNTMDILNFPKFCSFGNGIPHIPNPQPWPYTNSFIQDWGLDGLSSAWANSSNDALKKPTLNFDYMSWCYKYIWTSGWVYNQIYENNKPTNVLDNAQLNNDVTDYLTISGLVTISDTVHLYPNWIISENAASNYLSPGSDYCVETKDELATVIDSYCFDLSFLDYETGQPSSYDSFSVQLPYTNTINKIEVSQNSVLLTERIRTANSPTVTVLAPNGGEYWSSDSSHSITWIANDLDGDSLTYRVFYTTNDVDWVLLGTTTNTELTVNAANIAGGQEVKVRVVANDGINNSLDESDGAFVVEGKNPVVYITKPDGNRQIPIGSTLILDGFAHDAEDGLVQDESLVWSSSLDGYLGFGRFLYVDHLVWGNHIITLTATDTDGNETTTSVNVYVGERIFLPEIMHQ